uniref:Uncharacterized protein n=1 Tax=Arundo donax TaxID=35708 RepID=A0A0A9GRZ4_ARUDO
MNQVLLASFIVSFGNLTKYQAFRISMQKLGRRR